MSLQTQKSQDRIGRVSIFISYRRADSSGHAGRLADALPGATAPQAESNGFIDKNGDKRTQVGEYEYVVLALMGP